MELYLRYREALSLPESSFILLSGLIWLTCEGSGDVILRAGDEFIAGKGSVAQCLSDCAHLRTVIGGIKDAVGIKDAERQRAIA